MDSRSSLAARRSRLGSSGGRSSSSGRRGASTGSSGRTVRHGGSATGSSAGVACAAGGLAASDSTAASRAVSASWIAESAASVGSLIFFGVFAMSVVASDYAGPEQRRGAPSDRATSAFRLEIPSGPPSGSRQQRAAQPFALPSSYPIGLAYRRKLLVKACLIIVNGGSAWGEH